MNKTNKLYKKILKNETFLMFKNIENNVFYIIIFFLFPRFISFYIVKLYLEMISFDLWVFPQTVFEN